MEVVTQALVIVGSKKEFCWDKTQFLQWEVKTPETVPGLSLICLEQSGLSALENLPVIWIMKGMVVSTILLLVYVKP